MRTSKEPTIGIRDIVPDRIYLIDTVVSLFGVTPETAYLWCQSGRLRTLPRTSSRSPYRFLGSDLIALVGERLPAIPEKSETRNERAARVQQDKEEIARLLKR